MAWFLTESLTGYLAVAGDLLNSSPAEHTMLLGATATLRAAGATAFGDLAPLFGWWQEADGSVTAAFLHTPPFPVVLTPMAAGMAEALAAALAGRGHRPTGVNAGTGIAAAFASAWQRLTGDQVSLRMSSRLYRLNDLAWPDPLPPGQARAAGPADRELLIDWSEAFHHEASPGQEDMARMVDDRLSYGGFTVWETGGQPVSMAGRTRMAAGQVRVGPVYTPPGLRGRGYGGAVTCAVSQAALDAGCPEVVLFTDLANPTSNALYQRLGYRPVVDREAWAFSGGQ